MQQNDQKKALPVFQYLKTCFAKDIGIAQFAECLVSDPRQCRYVLPFGHGYFCQHPHRDSIVAGAQNLQSLQRTADVF